MKLKDKSPEELELMSYTDLTYMILKEEKKTMNTAVIFRNICELLKLSEDDFSEKIGDYYTSLTIDKRFVMLENGEWDVRDNHAVELSLDEDDDEEISEDETEEVVEEDEDSEENIDAVIDDDDLDDVEDDLEDLAVLDEDELDDEE